LIAGSYGMIGAAQLTTKACVRSGVGLVSVHAPKCAYEILQISVPEAMVSIDKNTDLFSESGPLESYQAIGIGPGLGKHMITQAAFKKLLTQSAQPMVIDADALNILAINPELLQLVPKNSILTPHPGEFRRLFGKSRDSKAALILLQEKAIELGVIIVLKGAFTRIASPTGKIYFNSTGNPGMATGGSGDVLTGLLTGLLAQPYTPLEAARIGVWLHGKAGDLAAEQNHPVAMCASDMIKQFGSAMQLLSLHKNQKQELCKK
jgi:NAD(P)H-hydrate epimerase